ncbi:hypothetical protein [Paenibacillus fonticola]|uniref:hypothetical protein n=1 Tax=Paenibacillus fonticola TaxID=379896 RepID=UPI00036034C0|nr:hypothetical protein [Paenibacillus fonticola]
MTLSSFIQEKKIINTDLISYFNQYEVVGEDAIKQGVIVPIYPIPNLDYTIVIKKEYDSSTSVPMDWRIFKTEPFPLKISSGLFTVILKKGLEADFGYILDFQRIEELPNFNFNKSIDEYDFIVDPLSK